MSSTTESTAWSWSVEQFGQVDLGDSRRTARLVQMGAAAYERPSGKVAAVFTSDAGREGAYDFLENDAVAVEEIVEGLRRATAKRCADQPFVFVAVDGTSVTVTDRAGKKNMGRVGSKANGARGLKVIDALAVDSRGTPVGLLGLSWWARGEQAPLKDHARQTRPLEERETRHWVETVRQAGDALDERGVRGWFQIDREGDGRDLLQALQQTEHWWTVRSNRDRNIELADGDVSKLRSELEQRSMSGLYTLPVAAHPGRCPREATMVVRVARVVLRLRDKKNDHITRLEVTAVWAREHGTTPSNEAPLDWMLYTNRPVETLDDALMVVWGYSQRWRVEEFHKTWKAGDCDIESSQLESPEALERWGTILAATAVRIERLKRLAREHPDTPASIELSPYELCALKTLRFGANPPNPQPTIAQAVSWLAELGGFANKYSGKPPGATVLGRGIKYLRSAARILELQHGYEK
jgi:hypothetical protein